MGTARRLYLYTVAAISLLAFAAGLVNLVAAILGELAATLDPGIITAGTVGREQVSLAIALILVGGPLFAIHWWLVERGWRGTGDAGVDDRRSAIRTFHFGLVATVALIAATVAALQIVDGGLRTVFGVTEYDGGRATDDWAMLVVAAPIWWWHARRRSTDIRHDDLRGTAWLVRLHRYGWAFAGLMMLLVGCSQDIETVALVIIGRPGFGAGETWWLGPLAWAIAMIVVGLGLFLIHADDARRAIRDAAIIGEDDRRTGLRMAYFGAVILVALAYGAITVTTSLAELIRIVLGVEGDTSVTGVLERVVGPLLVVTPFAVAGWLHWVGLRREARVLGPASLASARRLATHLAAVVGIAFVSVASAQLLGRVLEVAIGATVADEFFRDEIAWILGQLVVGAALWIPAWTTVLRRRAADPIVERHAAIGRGYLYLVVASALLAALPSAAFTLYRLIDTFLGGRGAGLGSDVALPAAIVLVAGIVAAYHGRLVVADMRSPAPARAVPGTEVVVATTEETPTGPLVAPLPPAGPAVPAGAETTMTLTLRGTRGADLQAVADALRTHLPPGVVLEGR